VPPARKGKASGAYRSKFEAKLAPALLAAGAEYEKEQLAYQLDRLYRPDWTTPSGVIIELKGYFPAEDRAKMRAVKAAHPNRVIAIVFQNALTTLTKKSKTTYAEWATKHGFHWAHKDVPASWLL
jgi:hypothetical protein